MAQRMIRALLALCCLLLAGSVLAAIEVREFEEPVLKERYESLNSALRCPKCENQAIGDSDSPIAGDMRERVYQLLQDGRSDREIQDYMIDRFGDYVLYNPRLSGRTWLLWGLPAGLVVLGAVIIGLLVRARRRSANRSLSPEERERINALINRERTE
ncbi:cytochrome c-type biogenesis protein CcmH [Modicisalibacter ilicicola DSM 19980]|uniref:Cytochrome c-type biogenesis protein n=1 Tax=Modicisalibacter ilicicola DSM 19980 TaxID=1121942 RepID=A0A1M4UXZ9_9GAMM|nr:cytochrome c-type biogenesis protein [Halomonas ilicicola]SHE61517.1 cytochrome c-type biogenesis protein CcmH [Halomonas ilicicola DSM 19980]